MKKNFRKVLSVVMILTMVFAMTATAFAGTDETPIVNFYIVEEDGTATLVDSVEAEVGQSVYDVVDSLSYYEPEWSTGTDVFNNALTTKYLTTYMGYGAVNVDHQYNSDGSGWSEDWGWLYTVGENHVMPTFPNEPNHGMAMNQYTIQNGDTIDVVYTLTKTAWDKDYNTTYDIVHLWY